MLLQALGNDHWQLAAAAMHCEGCGVLWQVLCWVRARSRPGLPPGGEAKREHTTNESRAVARRAWSPMRAAGGATATMEPHFQHRRRPQPARSPLRPRSALQQWHCCCWWKARCCQPRLTLSAGNDRHAGSSPGKAQHSALPPRLRTPGGARRGQRSSCCQVEQLGSRPRRDSRARRQTKFCFDGLADGRAAARRARRRSGCAAGRIGEQPRRC